MEKEKITAGEKTVAVSGGFDPVHIGHIRLFQKAKKLGSKLIVILNNDNWLKKKKGFVFMPQEERKEIIETLKCVDEVILTAHGKNPKDMSVCGELKEIRPDIFANGGDRNEKDAANPQSPLFKDINACKELGIEIIFNVGGEKIRSSSEIVENLGKEKEIHARSGFFMKRPWGKMWRLIKTKKFWLKIIFVKSKTSLQAHSQRTEWHIGAYKVPKNGRHVLNKGIYLELASGNLKEEDIIRYEDESGRS